MHLFVWTYTSFYFFGVGFLTPFMSFLWKSEGKCVENAYFWQTVLCTARRQIGPVRLFGVTALGIQKLRAKFTFLLPTNKEKDLDVSHPL